MVTFAKNKNMRYLVILLVSSISLIGCLNTTDKEKGGNTPPATANAPVVQPIDSANFTTLQWIDSSKSMGTITEGDVLKISYRFKNTGTKPLIIEKVQPGCGCTIADYPKQPIAPGQEGEVKAEFDSHGKEGIQKKNISVTANTAEHNYTLWFDVTINKIKS